MQVARDTVVSVDVELADLWGNVLQPVAPLAYLHGGYDDMIPALERALEGKQPGEQLTLRLEPEEAFGEYDDELLRLEPRANFPDVLEIGMQFEGVPGGEQDGVIYEVSDIADDKVVLDGNHPLAGIAIEFRCTVRDVRAATPQEIEQGHADDAGGVQVKLADS
jgi:FKBP-type peptidyl-prolyl cis-trans isomerase SlyD